MIKKLKNLVRVSWDTTAKERFNVILFIIIFILAYAVDLLSPVFLGFALKELAEGGFSDESIKKIILLLLGYVGVRVFVVTSHHVARVIQLRAGLSAKLESLERLLTACLMYPLRWHLKRHSGENLNRIHRASGAVEAVISTYIWQVIDGLVKIIFAASAIAFLNYKVVLIVFLTSAISIYFMLLFNQRVLDQIKAMNFFWDRTNKLLVDTLTNIVSVKMLSLEKALSERVANYGPRGKEIYKKFAKFAELKWGSIGVGFALMSGFSVLVYILDLRARGMAIDIAYVYILLDYLNRINQAISGFTGYYGGLLESATNFEDGNEILQNAPREVSKDFLNGEVFFWNELHIKKLMFRYNLSDLAGISCEDIRINNGDKIAIVGPSGSGKSTLMKSLAGLVEPQVEEIYLDGKQYTLKFLSSVSLLMPQEPELFSDTIRFNLVFNKDVPDETIQQALRIAEIDELIKRLPQGIETDLGHHGLSISVGEKQRIALARGFIMAHDYEILLLDEPTSSVDAITERLIFNNIMKFFASKTIFCTVHRLSMVPSFDKIIVVKDGTVVEFGTFEELTRTRGEFFKLWSEFSAFGSDVISA